MSEELAGFVERVAPSRVSGWAHDPSAPARRLRVAVQHGERTLIEMDARRPRRDLMAAGIGDGAYAFDIAFDPALPREVLCELRVAVKGTSFFLPFTATAFEDVESLMDCQLNVYNFSAMKAEPPASFGFLRFDPNNDCNLHCVYCHNPRSKDIIATDDFERFLFENVIAVHHFQIGCTMEPTLDARLADLMLRVGASPAKPMIDFVLQTNGILLHRHDQKKFRDAGLTALSVSIDAAEPKTQKLLRNGTSLDKVIKNVAAFRRECPNVRVELITTVTTENVDKLEALVALAVGLGVGRCVFREVFYHPDNDIVDHAKMPGLVLRPGQFAAMEARVLDRFGREIELVFADAARLKRLTDKMWKDSNAR